MQSIDALGDIYGRANLGYAALSPDGLLVKGNRCLARLIGVDPDDLPTRSLRALIVDSDRHRLDEWWSQARQRALAMRPAPGYLDASFSCELRMQYGSGFFWAKLTAIEAPEDDAAPHIGVLVRALDDSRQPPELTDEQGTRYRELFLSVPHPVLISDDASLRIVEVNDAAIAAYGYSKSEFLDMTIADMRSAEDTPRLLDELAAIRPLFYNSGICRHRKKDGALIWVEITIRALEFNQRAAKLVLARDITKRLQTESALRVSDQALKAISQGVLIAGVDRLITSANPAFTIITGYSESELTGRTGSFMQGPLTDPVAVASIGRALAADEPFFGEILNYRKDGSSFWNELSISPIFDDRGTLIHYIGVTRDISARKHAELALARQAELLDRTGELAKVGGWSVDVEAKKLTWTRETFRISDIDPPLVPSIDRAIELYAPEARPVIAAAVQAAIESGTPYDLELPLISAKGRKVWVKTQGFAETFDGKVSRIYGTFQDITQRRRAQEVQAFLAHTGDKGNESFFRSLAYFLAQSLPVDFVRISQRRVNEGRAKPLALWRDGRLSDSFKDGAEIDDPDWLHQDCSMATDEARNVSDLVVWDDCHACATLRDMTGQPIGLIVVGSHTPLQDSAFVVATLSELVGRATGELQRLKAKQALLESEERLRRIVDGFGPDVFTWLLTSDGKILMANNSALAVNEVCLATVMNKNLADTAWFNHEQSVKNRVELALEKAAAGSPSRLDLQIRTGLGELAWVDFSLHPVTQETGQVDYLVSSALRIEDRKRAEADLIAAKIHLQTTLDAIPDLVFEVDCGGRIIEHHTKRPDLLGAAPGAFLGKTIADLLPAEAADVCMRAIAEALQHGWSAGATYCLQLPKGETWFELSAAAMPVLNDRARHLILVARDITDRKRVMRQLRTSERALTETLRLLESTAAIAKVGGWELHADSQKIAWSPETCRIHEVDRAYTPELDDAFKFYPPSAMATLKVALHAALTFGTPYDLVLPLITAKGRQIWVRTQCTAVTEDGKVTRLLGAFHDITTQKEAEVALVKVERSFRAVTDLSPVPMALNDSAGNITFLNPSFVQIFGYDLRDIPTLADWWPKAYPDSDYRKSVVSAWATELERSRRTEEAFAPMELRIRCKDGSDRFVITNASSLSNDLGDIHLVLLYDITARRVAEVRLRETAENLEQRVFERTEALETARAEAERAQLSKTRFFTAASHDLLQPLNAARIFASNLAEHSNLPAGALRIAERIDAALRSAEEVIEALVQVIKLESGAVRPVLEDFHLQPFLSSLIGQFSSVAEQRGLRLRLGPCNVVVRSDPRLLRRVFQNLISNALRYTARGGVLVGVRRERSGQFRVDVVDTGLGIMEGSLPTLSEEFRRGGRSSPWGEKGMGLGLSICQRKCTLIGHEFSVTSQINHGSIFSVHMGLGYKAMGVRSPALPPVAESPHQPTLNLQVLCVDDDDGVLEAMLTLVASWGATCRGALSGTNAIAIAKQHRPDVVLVDYQFDGEDSSNGVEIVAALRELYQEKPPAAIMITANRSTELQFATEEAGISLLQKPLRAARLRSLLEALSRR